MTALIPAFQKPMSYIRFLGLYPKTIFYNGKGEQIKHIDEIYNLYLKKSVVWVNFLSRYVPAAVLLCNQARYLYQNIERGEYYYYIPKNKK